MQATGLPDEKVRGGTMRNDRTCFGSRRLRTGEKGIVLASFNCEGRRGASKSYRLRVSAGKEKGFELRAKKKDNALDRGAEKRREKTCIRSPGSGEKTTGMT